MLLPLPGRSDANPVWTADAGSWSVDTTGKYVQNATSGAASELRTSVTNSNGDYWFSYCIVNTAVTGARARMLFRSSYPTTVTFMLAVFYPGYMMLRQIVNSVDTTLYTNNSVSSASGTWYDVYIKAEGAHVEVWRGLMGQSLSKIAETDSATVLTGPYVTLDVPANVQDRYDNVRYAEGRTTTRSFSDDFTDGDYNNNPTWLTVGSWSAAGFEMVNTQGASAYPCYRTDVTYGDQIIRYSYKLGNASQSATPGTALRFRKSGNDLFQMDLSSNAGVSLMQYKGYVWTTLASNANALASKGQWYDVQVICEGKHIEVWWGTSGSSLQRILSTDSAEILEGTGPFFFAGAYTELHLDNIVVSTTDPVTTSYHYNNGNEMITMTTGGVNTTFVYDAWGRLVTKNQGSYQARYGYRFGDKLKDVASNFPGEAATVYYQYDGFGKRRNKTLDLVSCTWWRWDLGYNVIQEYADPDDDWDIENLSMTYIPGLAEVPGTNPATGSYRYYMTDHLGSLRTLRDQNKAAIAAYEYMPYGEMYNQVGLTLNHGFTGHTWDKDDGLYYAPYRYYNPVASRWLTRDPLGMKAGLNLYEYVKDRPSLLADPLGLQPAVVCLEEITQMVLVCIGGICTYVMSQQCIKAIVNGQCVWIPTGAKCGEDPCLRGGSNPNDKDGCDAAVAVAKANCKYGPTPACLMSLAIAFAVCSSPPPDGGLPPGIP